MNWLTSHKYIPYIFRTEFELFFKGTHTVDHVEFLTTTHTVADELFDLLSYF